MQALTYTHYGPPERLSFKEIATPTPADNEVLVKVYATTVNRTDCATIRAKPFFARIITGIFKPKKQTPGTEFSGVVESVGKNIKSLRPGDKVFGFDDQGAKSQAQFLTLAEDKMIKIPSNITFQQAAASSEGFHYALNFFNKVKHEPGQHILINGATGAIGSAAVQLAKHYNLQVTATCGTKYIETVKSLGADEVIDYTQQDFTQTDKTFNFVFDTVGKSSFFKCRKILKPGGVYISSDLGFLWQNIYLPLITPILKPLINSTKAVSPIPFNIPRTLKLIKQLIEDNQYQPLIDREYPFDEIVAAYQYVEQGHKIGNVVIIVTPH